MDELAQGGKSSGWAGLCGVAFGPVWVSKRTKVESLAANVISVILFFLMLWYALMAPLIQISMSKTSVRVCGYDGEVNTTLYFDNSASPGHWTDATADEVRTGCTCAIRML